MAHVYSIVHKMMRVFLFCFALPTIAASSSSSGYGFQQQMVLSGETTSNDNELAQLVVQANTDMGHLLHAQFYVEGKVHAVEHFYVNDLTWTGPPLIRDKPSFWCGAAQVAAAGLTGGAIAYRFRRNAFDALSGVHLASVSALMLSALAINDLEMAHPKQMLADGKVVSQEAIAHMELLRNSPYPEAVANRLNGQVAREDLFAYLQAEKKAHDQFAEEFNRIATEHKVEPIPSVFASRLSAAFFNPGYSKFEGIFYSASVLTCLSVGGMIGLAVKELSKDPATLALLARLGIKR